MIESNLADASPSLSPPHGRERLPFAWMRLCGESREQFKFRSCPPPSINYLSPRLRKKNTMTEQQMNPTAKVGDGVAINTEAIFTDDWAPELAREGVIDCLHEDGWAEISFPVSVRAEWDSDHGWIAVETY